MVCFADQGVAVPAAQPLSGLSWLIYPVELPVFYRDYWEQQPLLVQRDDSDYYAGLLSLDGVDSVLSLSSVRPGDLRLVVDGKETPISQLCAGPAGSTHALEALYAHYRNGSTIILNALDQRWGPLKQLSLGLSAEASSRFQANIYVTPAGAQGFKPHYDTHDVFVLQVHGTKRWQLYGAPLPLPLQSQPHDKSGPGPGAPEQEFDLQAGDLLYLPRGTIHAAMANDSTSVHITLGAYPMLWSEVIQTAIQKVFADDARFRKGLPVGFAADEDLHRQVQDTLGGLLDALRAQLSPQAITTESVKRAVALGPPALRHHLTDLEDLAKVGVDTRVRRRHDLRWNMAVTDQVVCLDFHNKTVQLPAHVVDEVRYVAESNGKGFTGASIPGDLDEPGRIVLVRALVREGFLTLA